MTAAPPEADAGIRPGEVAVETPDAFDAGLWFVGRIETPWRDRADCPRRGDPEGGPPCRLILSEPWAGALEGVADKERLQVLYWMHGARRDLLIQTPRHRGRRVGTFALRSPVRPNPIASSIVSLLSAEGPVLTVRGLDCLDGTPLLDVKPAVCAFA